MAEGDELDKYKREVGRLKAFLTELDTQISEEASKSNQRIAQLEGVIERQCSTIDGLSNEVQTLRDELAARHEDSQVSQIHSDNERLRTMISTMDAELCEKRATVSNLQTALNMMQKELDKSRQDEQLVQKMVRDLDERNVLIDQMNGEINRLKATINELRGSDSWNNPGGTIDKIYIKNLVMGLLRPPPGASRNDLIRIIANALSLNQEERAAIGLLDGDPSVGSSLKLGISDMWISYLLHESDKAV